MHQPGELGMPAYDMASMIFSQMQGGEAPWMGAPNFGQEQLMGLMGS